jgi:hypothetical protein
MMRRGGGGNPCPARRFAQRKAVHPAGEQYLLACGQQLPAQVAMVVGVALRPAARSFHLDSVQMRL